MKILRVSTLSLTLVVAAFALGFANPAFAGKPDKDCPGHPSCKGDDDGGEKAKFSVVVEGLTSGESRSDHPWWTGSKHGIGEADPHEDKEALVNFVASHFAENSDGGDNCFGDSNIVNIVREASIRERRGAMESMFWFDGETNDDVPANRETVTYILHMDGALTTGGNFPPAPLDAPSMMEMGHWRINVANGQSDVEPFACDESSGDFLTADTPTPVMITVTPQP